MVMPIITELSFDIEGHFQSSQNKVYFINFISCIHAILGGRIWQLTLLLKN